MNVVALRIPRATSFTTLWCGFQMIRTRESRFGGIRLCRDGKEYSVDYDRANHASAAWMRSTHVALHDGLQDIYNRLCGVDMWSPVRLIPSRSRLMDPKSPRSQIARSVEFRMPVSAPTFVMPPGFVPSHSCPMAQ